MTAITDHAVRVGLVYMPAERDHRLATELREIVTYTAQYERNNEKDGRRRMYRTTRLHKSGGYALNHRWI